jgi:hypothetical protein
MGKTITAKVKKPFTGNKEFTLPDGALIDLSGFDWGDDKQLTDKQKLFVFWYSLPFQECYHCGLKAARKAGYTQKSALVNAYKIRRDPKIDRLIKKLEAELGGVNLIDAVNQWLQEKIIRGNYDVKDFYETVKYKDKLGRPQTKLMLKPLEKMTAQQRLCVDGIDCRGQTGIMVYTLPDREKIRDSLISYVQKRELGNDGEQFDVETVAEIIKGNLSVKTKVISRNMEILANADGFKDVPKNLIEEE